MPEREKNEAAGEAASSSREALQAERDELYDRLLRTAADFDNWRKRAHKETAAVERQARAGILRRFLPVVDNLERALEHATGRDPVSAGVKLVLSQLLSVLAEQGVTRFEPIGERFDPTRHEAVDRIETVEMPPGTIASVLAPGYMLDDTLLRPAVVTVSTAPSAAESAGDDGARPD